MVTLGCALLIVGAVVIVIAVAIGKLTKAGRKLNDPNYYREQELLKSTEYRWEYARRMMTKEADVFIPVFSGFTGALAIILGLITLLLSLLEFSLKGPSPEVTFEKYTKALIGRDNERMAELTAFESPKHKEHFILESQFQYRLYDLLDLMEGQYGLLPEDSYQVIYRNTSRACEKAVANVRFEDGETTREEIAGQECLTLRFSPIDVEVYGKVISCPFEITFVKLKRGWFVRSQDTYFKDIHQVLETDQRLLMKVKAARKLVGKPEYNSEKILGEMFGWPKEQ